MLHNWSNVIIYAVVACHFRDPLTAEDVLCKCIGGLATETSGECSRIKDFKMEFELEFNYEDAIWRAIRFVASVHTYERIGSGRLTNFVQFLSED